VKPLTRLQQEAIKLRKIRLNQPPVTWEQAMKQFEEHRKAAQESGTRFYEWGVASTENFIVGMIRVHLGNSWFKCLTLGHLSTTGSSGFMEAQDV